MGQATVTASSVNVRSGPATNKKLLGRLNRGETFSYSSDQGGWLQTVYKNKTAFVCGDFVTTENTPATQMPAAPQASPDPATPEPAEMPTSGTGSKVRINKNKVNIRRSPSKRESPLGMVNKGTEFELLGSENDDWYKILYNGNVAYVMKEFADEVGAQTESPTQQSQPESTTPESTQPQPTAPTSTSTPVPSTDKVVRITKNKVNIRAEASKESDRLGVANKGNEFGLIGSEGSDWYKIVYKGSVAYVMKQFAKEKSASESTGSPSTGKDDVAAQQAADRKLYYSDSKNRYVRKYSKDGRHVKALYDLDTGMRFDISWKRPTETYHSDVTPNDKTATDTVKNIVNPQKSPDDYNYWSHGSSWNWKGHPGAIQLDNGVWVACGFHLRPHGAPQGGHPDRPWNQSSPRDRPTGYSSRTKEGADVWEPGGHFCLYYNENNGGGTDTCRDAVKKARNRSIPE